MAHHNFASPYTQAEYLRSVDADFTKRAPVYAEGISGEARIRAVRTLLEFYPPVCPTLDVACGIALLCRFHPQPQHVTGVDLTPAMLYEARKAFPQSAFVAARAESLPLRNGLFGSVYVCSALPYFTDPYEVFREAWRVLKRGGFVAYQAVTMDSYVVGVVLRRALEEVLGEGADDVFVLPHKLTDRREDNERLLREVGFVDVEMEMVVEEMDLNVDEVEKWWHRLLQNALTKRITMLEKEVLERVRSRYIDLLEEKRDVNNVIRDKVRNWYVRGVKPL